MNQEQLIKACKKKDRNAQKLLFENYKDTLFLTCLKYCRNYAEAEDTLHDVFIVIFETIKKYKAKGSFEGWMRRIAIYKSIDVVKGKKEYPSVLKNDVLKDYEAEENEILSISLDTILKAIHQLPDQYRLVFSLYQLDKFSHKEIANLLNISEGTSKSNYHRAKKILRDKLSEKSLKKQYYGA